MASKSMQQVLATFVLIVIMLALTPSVASFATDAGYQYVTDSLEVTPSSSNSTTLTYYARNDSATYEYFVISLNASSAYGLTDVEVATNITYTESTKTLTFNTGVLVSSTVYLVTVAYQTDDLTSAAVAALIPITPILWVVAVLAIGITAIVYELKQRQH